MGIDLTGINTYGLSCIQRESWLDIEMPNVLITITKRPGYCDRGHYGVLVETMRGKEPIMTIDGADGFPRYFFSLQRLFDELHDWIEFNKSNVYKP